MTIFKQIVVPAGEKEHDIKRMQTEGTKKAKDPTPSAIDPLPVFMLFREIHDLPFQFSIVSSFVTSMALINPR